MRIELWRSTLQDWYPINHICFKEDFCSDAGAPPAAAEAGTTVGVQRSSCVPLPTPSARLRWRRIGSATPLPSANRTSSFRRLVSSFGRRVCKCFPSEHGIAKWSSWNCGWVARTHHSDTSNILCVQSCKFALPYVDDHDSYFNAIHVESLTEHILKSSFVTIYFFLCFCFWFFALIIEFFFSFFLWAGFLFGEVCNGQPGYWLRNVILDLLLVATALFMDFYFSPVSSDNNLPALIVQHRWVVRQRVGMTNLRGKPLYFQDFTKTTHLAYHSSY